MIWATVDKHLTFSLNLRTLKLRMSTTTLSGRWRRSLMSFCKWYKSNNVSKAFKISGFIKRVCTFTNEQALRSLYISLVRSQLEYCSVIWDPWQRIYFLLTITMYNIRQTKAMKMRWLPEKYKLIGLVASRQTEGEGGPSSCVISVGSWVVHTGVSIEH